MKKYLLLLIILSLAICFIPANANATIHTFKDPTGVFTTGIFPKNEQGKYQRDIEWDFNLDPTINNQDADYNGYMDDDLKSEDLIDLSEMILHMKLTKLEFPRRIVV